MMKRRIIILTMVATALISQPVFAATTSVKTTVTKSTVVDVNKITVSIPDKQLSNAIRDTIKKPTGALTRGDLSKVKSLSLWNTINLTGVEYCINLNELSLDNATITNYGNINKLTKLTNVDINLGYNKVFNIKNLIGSANTIRTLNLKHGRFVLDDLDKFTQVTSLSFFDCRLDKLHNISALINLNDLSFEKVVVACLPDLKRLTNLEYITLKETGIQDINNLSTATYLKALIIDGGNFTDVKSIGKLKYLTELYLNYCKGIKNITELGNSSSLVRVNITACNINTIIWASNLRSLERLIVPKNKITNIKGLATDYLTGLDLSNNPISTIAGFDSMDSLSSLNLSNTLVTDISSLIKLKYLSDIDLINTPVKSYLPLIKIKNFMCIRTHINAIAIKEAPILKKTKDFLIVEE